MLHALYTHTHMLRVIRIYDNELMCANGFPVDSSIDTCIAMTSQCTNVSRNGSKMYSTNIFIYFAFMSQSISYTSLNTVIFLSFDIFLFREVYFLIFLTFIVSLCVLFSDRGC